MKKIIASLMLLLTAIGFSQNINTSEGSKTRTAHRLAKKFLRKQKIPGMSISVMQKGELIWSEGFGYAKRKPKVKIKPNETIFRIASISKSITAVMLAKLMDDNIIDLDKSIYYYMPNYPKKKFDFTIRELSGHLAGIRGYEGNEFLLNEELSISEGIELFKSDPLLFEPSSDFFYNSFGYVLLSEIIQKVTKMDFYTLVSDAVLKPLEMKQTYLDSTDIQNPNISNFFRKKRVLATPVSNTYKVAGGGFLSTSEDIAKFGNEIISPKIISENSLTEITTSQRFKTGNITGYGIGFSIDETKNKTPKYYHTGGGVGASTILLIYPEEAITICILTNVSGLDTKVLGDQLEAVFID
jgi:CubicO group peptidase (beta-lactamase class C family)